ncbi:MAG: sigma-54 dependent transcriptional regulator [Gemmatimonadetes bacterium]|nr:sigma-54 dependent transcriptional regulator [Gemmatimonadota bacterium]
MSEQIVVVEDDRELRSLLVDVLVDAGYGALAFATADDALRALVQGAESADLVVTDLILPGMRGQELLREVRRRRPELNVIVITAFGSIDSAIELVKAGAYDYITKPFSTDELLLVIERALHESRLRREIAQIAGSVAAPPGLVGASQPMRELFRSLHRVAASGLPVLITGESGTGKELIAQELHRISRGKAFVPVNCAAIPENLLESELFGHERGAFTGADREHVGLFESADGGTLFLDEIGELPLGLQPKLLRALESGEFRRVGAARPRTARARIIAATNRDLEDEVRQGRFREDLYWRLNVLHLAVPPLRERPADIPLLAEHLLRAAALGRPTAPTRIAPQAMALLTAYPWPGNARELRNVVERAAALAVAEEIRPDDLPDRILESGHTAVIVSEAAKRQVPLREVERSYIQDVLRQTGGNKSRAAEILGLDRKTLYRKLEGYAREDER